MCETIGPMSFSPRKLCDLPPTTVPSCYLSHSSNVALLLSLRLAPERIRPHRVLQVRSTMREQGASKSPFLLLRIGDISYEDYLLLSLCDDQGFPRCNRN